MYLLFTWRAVFQYFRRRMCCLPTSCCQITNPPAFSLQACIVQRPVRGHQDTPKLYDTRFFHFDKDSGRGQCLCGVARDSAVLVLQALTQGLAMQFNRKEWLLAAQDAPAGSPLRGFLAEKLALEAIRRRGLQGCLLVEVERDCTFPGGGEGARNSL